MLGSGSQDGGPGAPGARVVRVVLADYWFLGCSGKGCRGARNLTMSELFAMKTTRNIEVLAPSRRLGEPQEVHGRSPGRPRALIGKHEELCGKVSNTREYSRFYSYGRPSRGPEHENT